MSFNTLRFMQYLEFVEERHKVWNLRQLNFPGPWTTDPILQSKKFTNVFRILDPGSQFVFELDGLSERDTLMRIFLYRHTGRVDSWMYLYGMLDKRFPKLADLDRTLRVWQSWRSQGHPVFTGAYLVYPQSATPGSDKLESIIRLTQRLFSPDSPEDVLPDFLAATTQKDRFGVLRRNRGVADFMSMQILTDWGYLRGGLDFENEFVVPGPGCRKGISTITDTPDQTNFLHYARAEVMMGDYCPTLEGRPPSLMDVQNTMCEFSKYVRYLESGKTFGPYQPAHPGAQTAPVLPGHWATTTR